MKVLILGHIALDEIIIDSRRYVDVIGGPPVYGGIALTSFKDISVHIATSIGVDALTKILNELKDSSLSFSPLIVYSNYRTTRYALVYKGEERKLLLKSKCGPISYVIGAFDAVMVSPITDEVSLNIFEYLRKNSELVVLDPQGFFRSHEIGEVRPFLDKNLFRVMNKVDVIKISEEEASLIDNNILSCLKLLLKRVEVAIITRGSKGSLVGFKTNGGLKLANIPAFRSTLVDPTGAGDVFTAVFMIYYLKEKDPVRAGCIASAAASIAVEKRGPTRLSYETLMERADVLLGNVKLSAL
ncbi:MAG: hypothetical protein DRJ66_02275 [Thermoprotei archaeon]|mgnify:CR=1 FL=1|nr:MAG: hypothetical protein DRJ66_02275 [Thermoprotei archaeon]RLF20260.1 MAG: hypothetical protein DRZ82_02865 [Thermoprotei archaeon]